MESPRSAPVKDELNDELEVAAANERFYAALEDADLDEMDEVWLSADWVMCVHPGWEPIAGWDGVRESWRRIFENTTGMRVTPSDLRLHILGDLAWVSCSENLVLFLESSPAPVTAATTATNLFQRIDGRWRMVHHHASPMPSNGLIAASETIQ